jgi:hypothetical protein
MAEKRFNDVLKAGRDEPYTLEQFRMLLTEHAENVEASDALETVEHMARYFMEVRLPEYDGDDGDADNIAAEEFFEGIAHLAIWEHGEKSLLVQYLLAVLEDMRYQTGTGTLSYLIKPEEYEEERARG